MKHIKLARFYSKVPKFVGLWGPRKVHGTSPCFPFPFSASHHCCSSLRWRIVSCSPSVKLSSSASLAWRLNKVYTTPLLSRPSSLWRSNSVGGGGIIIICFLILGCYYESFHISILLVLPARWWRHATSWLALSESLSSSFCDLYSSAMILRGVSPSFVIMNKEAPCWTRNRIISRLVYATAQCRGVLKSSKYNIF